MDKEQLAALKAQGILRQKENGFFSLRLHLVAGNITAQDMKVVSNISEKYGRGYVGVTTRLNIEIPWIKLEDVERVKKELDEAGIVCGGTGMKVRTIVACKGSICPYGKIDTQKLCKRLDELYFGHKTPGKLKINISGCTNNCAKAKTSDIGIIGVKEGVKLFLGGKSGKEIVIGKEVRIIPEAQVVEFIGEIIDLYQEHAQEKERLADLMARDGINTLTLICRYGDLTYLDKFTLHTAAVFDWQT